MTELLLAILAGLVWLAVVVWMFTVGRRTGPSRDDELRDQLDRLSHQAPDEGNETLCDLILELRDYLVGAPHDNTQQESTE